MQNLILCLITESSQIEPLVLYQLHIAAAQGSRASDKETELPADQVGNGQLCPTVVNHQVRQSKYKKRQTIDIFDCLPQ